MLKRIPIIMLLLVCSLSVFGQDKFRLGILPFTGGPSGDGDTITTLISYQREILDTFTLVPLTNAVKAQVLEPSFQFSGIIDSDIISRLGRMLNADYVISGHIRHLNDKNLVVLSIVDVRSFEMVAGAYREYRRLDELPGLLPEIARDFITAVRRNTSSVPRLTVSPAIIAREVDNQAEAETLAQILLIELSNTGKFVVLPRISTNQAVMRELDYQLMGRAVNARYVLSTEIRLQGASNMATAALFNVEDGTFLPGGFRTYYALNDGISVMVELSRLLSGGLVAQARPVAPPPEPVPPPQPARPVTPPPPPPPAPPPKADPPPHEPIEKEPVRIQQPVMPERPTPVKKQAKETDPTKLWTIGFSAGTSFSVPWVIATVHGTIAPFKYSFLEIGCDLGLITLEPKVNYYSLYPFAHLAFFMPFPKAPPVLKGGWYVGAGAGYLMAYYTFSEGEHPPIYILAFDAIAGVNLFNFLDISYTLRTDFKGLNNKVSVGFTYRF